MKTTSKQAHNYIRPYKPIHQDVILDGLYILKEGTSKEIAHECGLKESQVHKRLSELEKLGCILNTQKRKKDKFSRVTANIWRFKKYRNGNTK